jgi:TonB-linked SusC/RagA family outer membrane protein
MGILALFLLTALPALAQQQSVTGKVTDAKNGESIPGVTVIIKGTVNAVMTDSEGKYSITIPTGTTKPVLVFSFMGYAEQEETVGAASVINVSLAESISNLDEVIVVGYGVQKKVSSTGSVASISPTELRNTPVSNLSESLSGKLSGVTITNYTGSPGTSSSLAVRAKGSWNNSDPLYVIDGVIRDKFAFDGLNPNDVESLSILKDGASTAVYGARAANGVVLINTRKGVSGKPVISYSGTVGISSATKITPTLNSSEHVKVLNDRYDVEKRPADYADRFTQDEIDYFKTHNWNWLDEALRSPVVTQHSLNVTGGNERVRYFIGGSYHYENGIFDNIDFAKYNLRGNIEANITKNLIASLSMNMDNRVMERPEWRWDNGNDDQHDLYKALLIRTHMVPPYINGIPVGRPYVEWHPLELINGVGGYDRTRYNNYEATASLQYNIPFIEGLSVKALFNRYDAYSFRKQLRLPYSMAIFQMKGGHNHIIDQDNPVVTGWHQRNDGNQLMEREQMDYSYQLNWFVTYNRKFGKHDVGAMFVYEQAEGTQDWFYAERRDYISASIDQLDAGGTTTPIAPTGSGTESGRLSYIGRVNYGFDNKYLFEASFRYDGSVKFAPSKRWGFFPSASAAWRISEESFFKDNISFINSLKLRVSTAMIGNDAVGGWQWAQRYNITNGMYLNAASSGIQAGTINNPYITWEKTLSYDGGLDATALNNRLSLALNIFYKRTYDILGSRIQSLPSTFGANMPDENYGEVSAKGFEIESRWNDRIGEFDYYVRGNLAYATNKYLKRDEAQNIRPYQSRLNTPLDLGDLGYIATGIIRTQAEADAILAANPNYKILGSAPEPGMMNYKDIRGPNSDEPDGVIDSNDREYIMGHTLPTVNYGFGLGGKWKGIGLDLYFQGVGNYNAMITGQSGARVVQDRIQESSVAWWADHWTPDNPNASMPRVYNHKGSEYSTFWMRNGAFLRLKQVVLSYELPKSLLSKLNIDQVKVFVEGRNLFLLEDHIKYFDPEVATKSDNAYVYPTTRSFTFGLNITL